MSYEFNLIKKEERYSRHNPGIFWLLIVLLLVSMALAVTFLSERKKTDSISLTATPNEIRPTRFYTVSYRGGVFSPTNLRIHAGDTVRFKNDSFFAIRVISDPHPAHNQFPGLDSVGDIPQGSYFSFTVAEKGIFGYHNEKNSEERGMIIVR